MSKQEVSALIQAIQETASFLLKQGMTGRPKIIVKEYDDANVEGLVNDYSDAIDDIIEDITDDPPTPPPTPTPTTELEILFGLQWGSLGYGEPDGWKPISFQQQDFKWSGLMSEADKESIELLGLSSDIITYNYLGGLIGTVLYDDGYDYELLGLYSDLEGTQPVLDVSNFYIAHGKEGWDDWEKYLCIWSDNSTSTQTPARTWKCRITTKDVQLLAYKADGTTSQCVRRGPVFKIDAIDNTFRTEAEINALGWYVRWNIYTSNAYESINIRNEPSLYTSTVIAVWHTITPLVGNPYLEQTIDGRTWQTVKFSTDGGTTVQTGYCLVDSQVPVTHTTGFASSDVLLTY